MNILQEKVKQLNNNDIKKFNQ